MVPSSVGAVVLIPFPFSDLSETKLRPAVVLASVGLDDWILYQITSNPYGDAYAVLIDNTDFAVGSLQKVSYARLGKLFTADVPLITSQVSLLKPKAFDRVVEAVISLLQPKSPLTETS